MPKKTHGMTGAPEYRAWLAMLSRCANPKNDKWKWYGGRGVTVCEAWRKDFRNFFADMGLKPTRCHTLDRYPNMSGNYEPGNCRWATWSEQRTNKKIKLITSHGLSMAIEQWAEKLRVPSRRIYQRFYSGWPVEEALYKPKMPHGFYPKRETDAKLALDGERVV